MVNVSRTIPVVAVVSAVVVTLASCGTSGETPEVPRTSTHATVPQDPSYPDMPGGAATGGNSPAPGVDALRPAQGEAVAVAKKYLRYRENAMSWNQETPTSWLKQVKPLMTDSGFAALKERTQVSSQAAGGPGYAWSVSHSRGYGVRVKADCSVQPAAGGGDGVQVLQCAVTDLVVDKSGNVVPTTQIPAVWPYVGAQIPAVLKMVKKGGKWLVDADWTGLAS